MRQKRDVMPKKSLVGRFPILTDTMREIFRNKETSYMDVMEDNQAGENHWGPLFYSIKSKILAYYILGLK